MRILHFVLILAVSILLKNVYCDSSNPLPNAPLSSFPKTKASPNFWKNIRWDGRDEFFNFLTHEISNKYTNGLRPRGARTLSAPPVAPPPPPPSPPKVTSYTLAVQWPPGVCSGKDNTCKIPQVPLEFTIHGLWPQYPPNNPPAAKTFDINKLAVMTTELGKSWPNLWSAQQQVSYNLVFWNREWQKHGKFSEMEGLVYFQKALDLFKDVGQGLRAALVARGIKPVKTEFSQTTYTLAQITDALRDINGGFSGAVRCILSKRPGDNVQQIHEIQFRYKQNFDKLDNSARSNCTGPIRFPA